MSISGIGAPITGYPNSPGSDGDSAAVEAQESAATQSAEKLNGNAASQTGSTSSGQQSDVAKIRLYASQDMAVSDIAQRLGQSVSTVVQIAQAAGINLTTGNSSQPANWNPATGNNVNTTA